MHTSEEARSFRTHRMPPKRDRSPGGRAAAQPNTKIDFENVTAEQKSGVARLVAGLALQYHCRKEILDSSTVSKAVKDFLGVAGDVRLRLDAEVAKRAQITYLVE
jgi:hypothetical protein